MNDDFFNKIITLQNEGKPDTAIDFIYQYVDDLCLDELEKRANMDFSLVNSIFVDKRLEQFTFDSKMALLICSRPFKGRLPNRVKYHQSLYNIDLVGRSSGLTRERFEKWLDSLI